MFRMCSRVFPKAKQISAGIVCNYRKDVGCPETYRDLVRVLHARYLPSMKDWPIEKLSTVTRGSMYLQMQPEHSVPAVFCISNQKLACAVKAYSEFPPVSRRRYCAIQKRSLPVLSPWPGSEKRTQRALSQAPNSAFRSR